MTTWVVVACSACGVGVDGAVDTQDEAVISRSDELYQAPNVTKWTNGLVPVCFTNSAPGAEIAWTKDALARTWAGVANVGFIYSNSCPFPGRPAHVQVTFDWITDNWGSRGVANIGMGSPVGTSIAVCAPNNPNGCLPGQVNAADYEESFRSVVTHEFGHLLGFIHEQQRPDATPICPLTIDGNSVMVPNGVFLTPTYDADSIMNYCRGWNGTAPLPYQPGYHGAELLSAGDVQGVRAAYGARRMTAWASPSVLPSTPPQTFTVFANDAFGGPVNAGVFFNGVRLGGVGQPLAAPTRTSTVCVWVPGSCDEGLCTKPHKECEPVTKVVPFTVELRATYFDPITVSVGVTP